MSWCLQSSKKPLCDPKVAGSTRTVWNNTAPPSSTATVEVPLSKALSHQSLTANCCSVGDFSCSEQNMWTYIMFAAGKEATAQWTSAAWSHIWTAWHNVFSSIGNVRLQNGVWAAEMLMMWSVLNIVTDLLPYTVWQDSRLPRLWSSLQNISLWWKSAAFLRRANWNILCHLHDDGCFINHDSHLQNGICRISSRETKNTLIL